MTERSHMRRLLWRWGRVLEFCKAKQREIGDYQEMEEAQRGLSAQKLTGMPRGTGASRPTERAALRINELADVYAENIIQLANDCEEEVRFMRVMDELIDELHSEHQKVLELRYKGGYDFQYIAFKMAYSIDRAKHLEMEAVDMLRNNVEVSTF